MKKLIALLAVMSIAAAANAGMIVTKLGLDGQGTLNTDSTNPGYVGSSTANPGLGISAEYLSEVRKIKKLKFGFGLEYLFPRALTPSGYGSFGFMPLYLTGQYTLCKIGSYKPYLKLNLGYNLVYNGDSNYKVYNSLNGGIYYAIGLGSNIYKNTIITELMYSTYVGDWGGKATDTYSVLGLKIGYCFDLAKK